MALYEILEDGTPKQIAGSRNIIAQVNPNVDYLKTEVVYDKNSSDYNKNWGYSSGIKGGVTVSGKDFSKYVQLKIYVNSTNIQYIYEMDLTTKAYKYVVVEALSEYPYVTGGSSPAYDAPANDMRSICAVSDDKTKFYHFTTGYNNGTTYAERNNYEYYYIYKIEGILKEPAMIYTGDELFAGDSVDITEGTISIKEKEFFNKIYPVGSIYTSTNSTSPAELFGIGAWEPLKDCFLWAKGDTTSITYTENGTSVTKSLTAGSRGGEFSHKLTTGEIPSHNHGVRYGKNTTGGNPQGSFGQWSWYNDGFSQFSSAVTRLSIAATQNNVGSNQVHNNMPPYLSVYMWKRVQE